jgi:hypothetical protein
MQDGSLFTACEDGFLRAWKESSTGLQESFSLKMPQKPTSLATLEGRTGIVVAGCKSGLLSIIQVEGAKQLARCAGAGMIFSLRGVVRIA